MFTKRTRLYTNFNISNFFYILKSLFTNKKNFEKNLQEFLHVKNLRLTSLGRVALFEIIKLIIENSKKRKFFIAPYTIPAVIHAIKYAGGEIEFIDIDKQTGLINEKKLETKIDNESAGVIITHLYSNSNNIQKFISKFKNRINIIEDAAINFGAKINGEFIGTLAHYGFYSFNVVKNLNTLNGGAIYIRDNNIYNQYLLKEKNKKIFPIGLFLNLLMNVLIIKILFNNFSFQFSHLILKIIYKKKFKFILKKIYPILYHKYENKIPEIYFCNFNWLMNEVGIYNLKNITSKYKERLRKAKLYYNLIKNDVAYKMDCFSNENALLEYPIILKNIDNQVAHKRLMNLGFDIRHTWYLNNVKYDNSFAPEEFKDTCFIENRIFCLPIHENISENDIKNISSIINSFDC